MAALSSDEPDDDEPDERLVLEEPVDDFEPPSPPDVFPDPLLVPPEDLPDPEPDPDEPDVTCCSGAIVVDNDDRVDDAVAMSDAAPCIAVRHARSWVGSTEDDAELVGLEVDVGGALELGLAVLDGLADDDAELVEPDAEFVGAAVEVGCGVGEWPLVGFGVGVGFTLDVPSNGPHTVASVATAVFIVFTWPASCFACWRIFAIVAADTVEPPELPEPPLDSVDPEPEPVDPGDPVEPVDPDFEVLLPELPELYDDPLVDDELPDAAALVLPLPPPLLALPLLEFALPDPPPLPEPDPPPDPPVTSPACA